MTIHLGCPLLDTSRNLPERQCEDAPAANRHRSYSVLLPVGFTMPPQLPLERCALTAPFHPYPWRTMGGLLSVALSLGLPPPGVTRHRIPVEPGLSSHSTFRFAARGHPTVWPGLIIA
jgi:hypothetical protein